MTFFSLGVQDYSNKKSVGSYWRVVVKVCHTEDCSVYIILLWFDSFILSSDVWGSTRLLEIFLNFGVIRISTISVVYLVSFLWVQFFYIELILYKNTGVSPPWSFNTIWHRLQFRFFFLLSLGHLNFYELSVLLFFIIHVEKPSTLSSSPYFLDRPGRGWEGSEPRD